ncbi:MAG: D-alanine--D-alanine ligase [Candidatus Competibacteraceae bacterium]|nr:D-alanine--D-alanine ligase [Candidatus Competibacteraceae bacterium]
MIQVAVVCGGYSGEYDISLKSADCVMAELRKKRYACYKIVIGRDGWMLWEGKKKYEVNRHDFSVQRGKDKLTFDVVYNIVHGTPGEDGKLQGYWDMLGLPYTSPGVMVSALTMNKYITKLVCKSKGMKVAKGVLLKDTDKVVNVDKLAEKLNFPFFVKPNHGGSSVATVKCYSKEEAVAAIEAAFGHDREVIVEQYVKGRELTCGVYKDEKGEVQALPVTEIVPHNDFFDYEAKYEGKSDEITPARIGKKWYKKTQESACKIYELLHIDGLVRIDFILRADDLYFMEVNTIPGFSKASIVPQQIRAAGKKESDILDMLIRQALQG